eukprot:FR742796.1.p1 GENE.FR742796.1~~FR742796.1.p1  ORF type:complete len:225 (+),score=18.79 FR742796.1:214-888(+)
MLEIENGTFTDGTSKVGCSDTRIWGTSSSDNPTFEADSGVSSLTVTPAWAEGVYEPVYIGAVTMLMAITPTSAPSPGASSVPSLLPTPGPTLSSYPTLNPTVSPIPTASGASRAPSSAPSPILPPAPSSVPTCGPTLPPTAGPSMPPRDDGEENGNLNYIMIGGILGRVGGLVGGTAYLLLSAKPKTKKQGFRIPTRIPRLAVKKAPEMRNSPVPPPPSTILIR